MAAIMALWNNVLQFSEHAKEVMSSNHNLITVMDCEVKGGAATSLTVSEFRFFLCFIMAVFVGGGIRLFRSPTMRHLYALVTGFLLVYYPFGSGVLQAAAPCALTYLAMALAPRSCGRIAWAVNFPYLIWLHVINASGTGWGEGQLDFTGADMILVLKLISLAVAYQDSFSKKPQELTEFQAAHRVPKLPNPLEFLSFVFCIGNLLGGPYLEFSEYKEFIELKGVWDPSQRQPSPWRKGLTLVVVANFFIFAHVQADALWGINPYTFITTTPWYPAQPLFVRWLAVAVCGFTFQFKYYYAWLMAEAALTFAGLNFIGWEGDTALWGRQRNADVLGMWFADSGRVIPSVWNIQTGVFLRHYVYDRLRPANGKPGFVQLLATQVTSALWHGLYAGYLMFFVTTVFFMSAATVIYKLERAYLPPKVMNSLPWKALKVFYTCVTVSHICAPFIVLLGDQSLAVWADVYFAPHILILTILAVGQVVPTRGRGGSRGGKKGGDGAKRAEEEAGAEPKKDL